MAWLTERLRDPLYANGVALVANAGVSAALGFAFWFVAARRFPADALGVGAAVVSAATLAALVGKAGFDAAVIRYAPSKVGRSLRKMLFRALAATLGLTALVAVVVLALAVAGVSSLAVLGTPAYAAGFVLLALATGGAWILDALFIAEQRASAVLLRNVAFNVTKLVVPLVLVYEWGGRAVPLAWGVGIVASLVVAAWLLPRAMARSAPAAAAPPRRAFGYAMRNYALNLSEFLPGLVLPILVLDALGPEENARFFLAWTIAATGFLASKAIAQSAFAALVRDADDRRGVLKGLTLSALVLGPGTLVLVVGAPLILAAFGAHYVGAASLLRALALSIPAVVVLNLYLAHLKARDAGVELTLLPLLSLAVVLAVLPLALAWGGIEGAGLAWLGVQLVLGAYAAIRLALKIGRSSHASRTRLRRHPHQG